LHTELQRHLDAGRRRIRIDAGYVTFIDSAVIQELVEASERCHAERGSLILTNVPTQILRVVKDAGLEAMLLIDTAGDSASRRPA
jgi:anti-anti-sigma factor